MCQCNNEKLPSENKAVGIEEQQKHFTESYAWNSREEKNLVLAFTECVQGHLATLYGN